MFDKKIEKKNEESNFKQKLLTLNKAESNNEQDMLPAQASSTGGSNYQGPKGIELNVMSPEPSPAG